MGNPAGNSVGNLAGNVQNMQVICRKFCGNVVGNDGGNAVGNLVGNGLGNDVVFSLNTWLRTIYCLQAIHEPACVITLFQYLNFSTYTVFLTAIIDGDLRHF